MTSNILVIGISGAFAAALAQAIAHQIAQRHRWRRIPRYVAGVTIIALAFAPVVFSALSLEYAAVIYGLLWLIIGASGLATWISYENDPKTKPGETPDADAVLQKLDEELGQ